MFVNHYLYAVLKSKIIMLSTTLTYFNFRPSGGLSGGYLESSGGCLVGIRYVCLVGVW